AGIPGEAVSLRRSGEFFDARGTVSDGVVGKLTRIASRLIVGPVGGRGRELVDGVLDGSGCQHELVELLVSGVVGIARVANEPPPAVELRTYRTIGDGKKTLV